MNELPLREKVSRRLQFSPKMLALHEFNIPGVSENNLGTRLPQYAKEGLVVGRVRPGTNYKEWGLAKREKNGQGVMI